MTEAALRKKLRMLAAYISDQFNALQSKSIVMDRTSNNNLIKEGQTQETYREFHSVETQQIRSEINLS